MIAARKRQARRNQLIAVGVVVAVIAGIALLTSTGGGKKTNVASTNTTLATDTTAAASAAVFGATACPNPDGSSPRTATFAAPFKQCIDTNKTYTATMETDAGTIVIALAAKQAPGTVNNFVSLARSHFFDGLTFHRVIPDFVLQGGDPQGTGQGGPGYKFGDELPKPEEYKAGSLAMANSGANTNGSQFFVVTSEKGAKTLVDAVGGSANYTLFGQVTSGMEVVKKIEADGSPSGKPTVLHKIVKVTIAES